MRSLRWLPGAQEGGKGSEKYKHKYNYNILARSLILSVMNYKKLFIKIETPSIRSPTAASFSLQKNLNSSLACDKEPFQPFPPQFGCKMLLSKTVLVCRAQRRIIQMSPFPAALPRGFHRILYVLVYKLIKTVFISLPDVTLAKYIYISITDFLYISLCTYFLEYSVEP